MNFALIAEAVGNTSDPLENAQAQIKEAETFFGQMWNSFVGYLPTLIAAVIILVVGIKIFKLSGVNIYAYSCKISTGGKIKIIVAAGYSFWKKTVKSKFNNGFLTDTANRCNGIADINGDNFISAGSKAVIVDNR